MPGLLARLRSRRPASDVVLAGLHQPKFTRLRLERFARGADNYHIDVALGPILDRTSATYVKALVRENVQHLWKQPVSHFSEAVAEAFHQVLEEHHRALVRETRHSHRLERVQLFQFALLKLLLNRVDGELSALRMELEDARVQPARQVDGKGLELHQQKVTLARHAGHVRYRVARQLIRDLMRLEHGGMRRLRKSALGLSWPIPEAMLTNPVLQLDGIGCMRDFARVYPFLLYDLETSCRVGRCVLTTLAPWLPDNVAVKLDRSSLPTPSGVQSAQGAARGLPETERRARYLVGQAELGEETASWLDLPDNATALLGGAETPWPRGDNWRHPGIGRVQRELNAQLATRLRRVGLLRKVIASYELTAVYASLGLVDAEALVFDFLCGDVSRRETLRRLGGVEGAAEPAAVMRRIEELRRAYGRRPTAGRPQVVARFAGDFLRLRRDLKWGWRAFAAMDTVRLVTDEDDLARSRANNLLQVFSREDLAVDTRGSVVGHVIVAVDIRDGEALTTLMRRRNLNAAEHFSRYLYEPLARLVERFDAQKVAVQGDTLILSLLEYGGEGVERLAVARACCLAGELLELAQVMNAENERVGLGHIELGLGIAYVDEAPTYLYDQGHRIVVSPAIQIGRRLATCHGPLRSKCTLPHGSGVCVASPVDAAGDIARGADGLVRYNVNGIELDAPAFDQLNTEIRLRRLGMRVGRGRRPVNLYAACCPDVHGEGHWLVVREQAVRLWMGRQLLESGGEGRHYYEVITDRSLIGRVRDRLSKSDVAETETAADARQFR